MLALVAGEGDLPGALIAALDAQSRAFRLCELDGHPCAARGNRPVMRFRIETLGNFLTDLVRYGTTEICFAGRIDRPAFDPTKIDAATQPLIPDLIKAMSAGDDAALRIVMTMFEARGIAVVPAQDILPDLLPAEGVLTRAEPSAEDIEDTERGIKVIAALGAVDVGQACVVASGQVLAVEAMPGTDWMLQTLMPETFPSEPGMEVIDFALRRISEARKGNGLRPDGVDRGGVLIKAAKPGQDRRVDLPTIGPGTIHAAARAGLGGIVIEAGGVMVLHQDKAIERANALGMFVWVRG